MPVKDMKPIDLENAEVRFDYGSRFKEISKLSEDEDLFRSRDFKELSDSFLQFGDLVSELWLAVDHLMQLYLDGDLKPSCVILGNTWRRMHGLKPRRRTLRERRWKPSGKGKRGKLNRA
jgi:hypothetical protein